MIYLRLDKVLKVPTKFVANAPEGRQPFLFGTSHRGGVIEAPMDALRGGRKDRATLLGAITDGYHIIERLPHKLVYGFRPVARDINPDFTHRGNGFRAEVAWFGAGARDLERSASIVSKQPFRHLASSRVSCAEDQNSHDSSPFLKDLELR
jgi:hypothetical protein